MQADLRVLLPEPHNLFDFGYLTVTTDFKVEVSRRFREEFENGRHYYALHGQGRSLPQNNADHPAREFLAWHNSIFRS